MQGVPQTQQLVVWCGRHHNSREGTPHCRHGTLLPHVTCHARPLVVTSILSGSGRRVWGGLARFTRDRFRPMIIKEL